jgi:hypothetical protein
MLVALAALFVSVCAVAVSMYEAWLDRQQAKASVWPHVELTISISGRGATITVLNSGIGPASLDAVEVRVDGRPASGWPDVFARLLDKPPDNFSVTSITGRVLRAGDEIAMLALPPDVLPGDIMARLPNIGVEICYRSVFDERWILRVPKLVGASAWRTVSSCGAAADGGSF